MIKPVITPEYRELLGVIAEKVKGPKPADEYYDSHPNSNEVKTTIGEVMNCTVEVEGSREWYARNKGEFKAIAYAFFNEIVNGDDRYSDYFLCDDGTVLGGHQHSGELRNLSALEILDLINRIK